MWLSLLLLVACSSPVEERISRVGFTRVGAAPAWVLGPEGTYASDDGSGPLASLELPGGQAWGDLRQPDRVTLQGVMLSQRHTYTWTGALPADPVFDATVVGAGELTVRVNGEGGPVTQTTRLGETPTRWKVPLTELSGEATVTLTFTGPQGFVSGAVVRSAQVPPRRVVVIGMDTTRPDHFSGYGYPRPTTPKLDELAQSASVFRRAWAPAPRTRPSFRTATTGRWPLEAVGAVNIGAVFHGNGFATAGFTANPHLVPRFDFNDGFDTWRMDGTSTAEQQVDLGLAWLQSMQDRDAYLFLHVMDPHLRYQAPEPWASTWIEGEPTKAMPRWTRSRVYRAFRGGKLTEAQQEELEARYDGELAYTDDQLGRFLDGLDQLEGETLLVVHSDHGEEFWEHGAYEHNHSLYEELVRTVLMVRAPRQAGGTEHTEPVSLVDIAPTLFQLTGLEGPEELDGHTLAPMMVGETPSFTDRPLPVGLLRYESERWGVVVDDHKYILHTEDGRQELYDLAQDPGEQHDLAASAQLGPYQQALSEAHGMPVGPGWRIQVTLRQPEPVTLLLPEPCEDAGVFDPWRLQRVRENLVWGEERKSLLPEQVATVSLSDDKRTVTITPGEAGKGVLWVRFGSEVPLDGTLRLGAAETRVRPKVRLEQDSLRFSAGIVLDPPMHEADRIALLQQAQEEASDGDLELLRQLGYLGDE